MEANENEFKIKNEYDEALIKKEREYGVLCEVKEEIDITGDDNTDQSDIDVTEIKSYTTQTFFKPIKLEEIINEAIEPSEQYNFTDSFQDSCRNFENSIQSKELYGAVTIEDEPIELKKSSKMLAVNIDLDRSLPGHSRDRLCLDQKGLKNNLLMQKCRKHFKKNTKLFECNECNRSFTDERNLISHVAIHTGPRPFRCIECKRSFTCSSYLKRHMTIHTGCKLFKCNECNKSFSHNQHLKSHVSIHTGYKPFMCNECNKSFAHKPTLLYHIAIHKGLKSFKCNDCNKCFIDKRGLKRHMTIHTGHKPFKCKECNKSFACISYLNRHLTIHTGQKPFKCNVCNKSLAHRGSLKKHMATHTAYSIQDIYRRRRPGTLPIPSTYF